MDDMAGNNLNWMLSLGYFRGKKQKSKRRNMMK